MNVKFFDGILTIDGMDKICASADEAATILRQQVEGNISDQELDAIKSQVTTHFEKKDPPSGTIGFGVVVILG